MAFSGTYDGTDLNSGNYHILYAGTGHYAAAPSRLQITAYATLPRAARLSLPPGPLVLPFTIRVDGTRSDGTLAGRVDALMKVLSREGKRLVASFSDTRWVTATWIPGGPIQHNPNHAVVEGAFHAEHAYWQAATPSVSVQTAALTSLPLEAFETGTAWGYKLSLTPGGGAPTPLRALYAVTGANSPTRFSFRNRYSTPPESLTVSTTVASGNIVAFDPLLELVWISSMTDVRGYWLFADASGQLLDFSTNSRDLTRYAFLLTDDGATTYYKLDETSGTSAADAIGSATGTYTFSYTLGQTAGMPADGGTAVLLTASGTGYVNIGANAALLIETNDFSWDGWVYFNSVTNVAIFGGDTGAPSLRTGSAGKLKLDKVNAVGGTDGTAALSTGQWYHLAVVFDSTAVTNNCSYYINGVLDATVTFNNDFTIGAYIKTLGQYGSSALFLDGYIDDFAFYKSLKLTAAQILVHYRAGKSGTQVQYNQDGPEFGAVDFDGTGGIAGSSSSALALTSNITLMGWVNADTLGAVIAPFGKAANLGGFAIWKTAADVFAAAVGSGAATRTATGTTAIVAGRWYHVCMVWDAAAFSVTLYLDGEIEAQATGAALTVGGYAGSFTVGAAKDVSSTRRFWDGKVASPAVLAVALTQTQIRKAMSYGLAGYNGTQATAEPGLWPQLHGESSGSTNPFEFRVTHATAAPAGRLALGWRAQYPVAG